MWNGIRPQVPMRYSKYRVDPTDYPFGYWFPPFCNGPCAALPVSASAKLLNIAENSKQNGFGLEDVLYTGIYREIANITNIKRLPYICEHFSTHKESHLKARLLRYHITL